VSETTTYRRTRQLKGQLTDLKLRNLETRAKPYKVADGNGLFVLVSPSGLRAWRWKYRFAGKEKVLPLGKYPDVTLADARRVRDEARVNQSGVLFDPQIHGVPEIHVQRAPPGDLSSRHAMCALMNQSPEPERSTPDSKSLWGYE